MYPHEKPGYVDACRAAGVCPSVLVAAPGVEPVYCDRPVEGHPPEGARHYGLVGVSYGPVFHHDHWYDGDCAPLEGGTR